MYQMLHGVIQHNLYHAGQIAILKKAHDAYPNNGEILNALVSYHRDRGDLESARFYAGKLNRPGL